MRRLLSILPRIRVVALLAFGAALAVLMVRTAVLGFANARPGSLDDAFICLIYARHLASTGRIFYNAVDGHLDGFTSMLDVLLKSLSMLVSSDNPLRDNWWTSALFQAAVPVTGFVAGFLLFVRAGASKFHSTLGGALLGFMMAANPALAYASAFLLETPLYTLLALITASIFLVSKRPFSRLRLGVFIAVMAALTLARPEGLSIALMIGAATLLDEHVANKRQRIIAGAAFGSFVLVYYVAHRIYFGAWAPNSYYAKASASRLNELRDGLEYVSDFFHSADGWLIFSLLPPALACLIPRWQSPAQRLRCACISAVALIVLIIVIVAGGDCYRGGRFIAAPLCLGALALTAAAAGLTRPFQYGAVALLLGIVAVEMAPFLSKSSATALWRESPKLHPPEAKKFSCDEQFAERLTSVARGGTIAQTDFQRLKYFSDEAQVLDVTGLNNREIAHRPTQEAILWGRMDVPDLVARAPELIVLGHHVGAVRDALSNHPLVETFENEKLREHYFGYRTPVDSTGALAKAYVSGSIRVCQGFFSVLVRRDFAEVARKRGVRIGS